jgi:hypothetical protein
MLNICFVTNSVTEEISWDMTLCSQVKVSRRFGGTYCLHLQGRRESKKISR